jgi:uncharacterized membrane protein YphA (DoxX/SURF4 family)
MDPDVQVPRPSKTITIIGWVISILPVLMLLMSATMKFLKPPGFAEGIEHLGWAESQMFALGILELACTVIYLIPRASVLGAILLAAYLGGATTTHVRVGDPFISSAFVTIVLGILVWLGLWLREPRLRALLPFRS